MNPGTQQKTANGNSHAPGIGPEDILFTLFRHKRLILAFLCLGLAAAGVVYLFVPTIYVSRAKLLVPYIVQTTPVSQVAADQGILKTDPRGESVMNSELAILTSLNVATNVVGVIGADKILAKLGGGDNPRAAAGVVRSGIDAEVPRKSDVIVVSFEHPDREVVQPVLGSLIEAYMHHHNVVRQRLGILDAEYDRENKDFEQRLAVTESKLKSWLTNAGVIDLEKAKQSYQGKMDKLSDELLAAKIEEAGRRAILGQSTKASAGNTNALEAPIPPDKVEDYGDCVTRLARFKSIKKDLYAQGYTEEHPQVRSAIANVIVQERMKLKLEQEYPALLRLGSSAVSTGTNSFGADLAAQQAALVQATAKVEQLETLLSNVQAQAYGILSAEPEIMQLVRQKESYEARLRQLRNSMEQRRNFDSSGSVSSMSVVQTPSPPAPDKTKLMKLLGVAFGGCVGLGLALAFLIDFVLDHTIKRPIEVERHLHLPLLLSIPDTHWDGRLRLPGRRHRSLARRHNPAHRGEHPSPAGAVTRWDSRHNLQLYAAGLRERLITYFEINPSNQNKPKRVAVTSCGAGAGVTTIATSLASALSRAPGVKVLLVDMNMGQGVARTFRDGEPCSNGQHSAVPADLPKEPQTESTEPETGHQSVPTVDSSNSHSGPVLPSALTHLAPQFEANDHDYIIFDLPPVSQTSMTPRLSGYMDLVLLVLESERTGRQLASRASALMRESRANVAAVLNKCHRHLPARLSQEL